MKYLLALILTFTAIVPLSASPKPPSQKYLGQIGFDGLRVENIIIGIEPYEREQPQDLLIDMRVSFDLNSVVEKDDLAATVDYVKLGEMATELASDGAYYFIDVLGLDILSQVFSTFTEVENAYIKIQKPAAIPSSKSGGVIEISLEREDLFCPKSNKIFGKIGFDELLVHTVIGDLPVERENEQPLLVDVRASIDLKSLIETGELQATVNYVEMAKLFEEVAREGKYQMIETLAVNYINKLYVTYPYIEEVYVRIRKPGTLPNYPFKNDAVTEVRI